MLSRGGHRRLDVVGITRHHDADRRLAVVGAVVRVGGPVACVEVAVPMDGRPQGALQRTLVALVDAGRLAHRMWIYPHGRPALTRTGVPPGPCRAARARGPTETGGAA